MQLGEHCDPPPGAVLGQVQLSALDSRPLQSGMASWCEDNGKKLIAFGTVGGGLLSERYLGAPAPSSAQLDTARDKNRTWNGSFLMQGTCFGCCFTPEERGISVSCFGWVRCGGSHGFCARAASDTRLPTLPRQQGCSPSQVSLRMYGGTTSRFGGWELQQELLRTMSVAAKKHGVSIANVAQRYVLQCSPSVAAVLIGVRNSAHIAENAATHSFALDGEDMAAIRAVIEKRSGPKGDVWDLERGYV